MTTLSKPVRWLLRNRGFKMTENPHIIAICGWPEAAGGVVSSEDVSHIYGYYVVYFEFAIARWRRRTTTIALCANAKNQPKKVERCMSQNKIRRPLTLLVDFVVLEPESVGVTNPHKLILDYRSEKFARTSFCCFQHSSRPNVHVIYVVIVHCCHLPNGLSTRRKWYFCHEYFTC